MCVTTVEAKTAPLPGAPRLRLQVVTASTGKVIWTVTGWEDKQLSFDVHICCHQCFGLAPHMLPLCALPLLPPPCHRRARLRSFWVCRNGGKLLLERRGHVSSLGALLLSIRPTSQQYCGALLPLVLRLDSATGLLPPLSLPLSPSPPTCLHRVFFLSGLRDGDRGGIGGEAKLKGGSEEGNGLVLAAAVAAASSKSRPAHEQTSG